MKLSYSKPTIKVPLSEDSDAYVLVNSMDLDIQLNLALIQDHPEKLKELVECTISDIKGVEFDGVAATMQNVGKWPTEMVVDVVRLALEKITEATSASKLDKAEKN